jgi:hypothetical protein
MRPPVPDPQGPFHEVFGLFACNSVVFLAASARFRRGYAALCRPTLRRQLAIFRAGCPETLQIGVPVSATAACRGAETALERVGGPGRPCGYHASWRPAVYVGDVVWRLTQRKSVRLPIFALGFPKACKQGSGSRLFWLAVGRKPA